MTNFTLRFVLLLAVLLMISLVGSHAQETTRPNIIFILADDLGWSSLSCRMEPENPESSSDFHETRIIERLARDGMRFSRAYASASICSPSRRSILLGKTPARLGDESFADKYDPRRSRQYTIPIALKAIDGRYRAAHFGKWDMRADFFPEDAGYDESDGDTGNRHGSIATERDDKWTTHFQHDDPKLAFTLADRANNFMERQVRTGNPFYLQISHYATHVDIQSRPDTYAKYKGRQGGKKHAEPGYAAMLEDLDASIGLVLDKVAALGIADRTYIFFMSDNGAPEFIPPVRNRLDPPSTFASPMRNDPLRGGKWTLYEGGIRVPLIVSGPGITANSHCDVPVAGWDLLPTFCALAGGQQQLTQKLDGGSFSGMLKEEGKREVDRPAQEFVFHRYHNTYPHSAMIDGDFKVIKFWKSGKVELYNISRDPGEEKDIAFENPNKTRALADRMTRYLEQANPGLTISYGKE